MQVDFPDHPPVHLRNSHYPSYAPPLLLNALVKLPLGSVKPRGWLAHQLELMAEGMTGRLYEVSAFIRPGNGWLRTGWETGEGWEEQPYWFRGYHDLAVLTGNERLLADAKWWIEEILASQDEDGYFGAQVFKHYRGKNGREVVDLWPHMVMLDAIIHHYEHTGDKRVLPFMTRFFEFCRKLPPEELVPSIDGSFGDWRPIIQVIRAGDMIPHLHWLYSRTGEPWLLKLATRFFQKISPPHNEFLDNHIVNFTQRFSYPGLYYAQSRKEWHLRAVEYWYALHMAAWGQQPRGIFGADETTRSGKTDPRQGFETCGFVEFCKSNYMLSRITGDTIYADRCEDLMFNHFPASQTPDLKGLHYLTAANMPQLDASGDHDFQNKGRQINYSAHDYRCCQHNVAMGWPWLAENLWQATPDDGLAAWIYSACEVTARVGREGKEVRILEETDYPFRGEIGLSLRCDGEVHFPLYLRVPRWCEAMRVSVNGEEIPAIPPPGKTMRIDRAWVNGDRIHIEMPMSVRLTEWPRTGAVTVDRGPLSYSVRIEERWEIFMKVHGTEEWPEWEVFPESPWNYGLVADKGPDPCASVKVIEKKEIAPQPWTLEATPIELQVRARKIPDWTLEPNQTVQELRKSPIRSEEPEETVTLIPLGCARLRIACLPVIGEGTEAREWREGGK